MGGVGGEKRVRFILFKLKKKVLSIKKIHRLNKSLKMKE